MAGSLLLPAALCVYPYPRGSRLSFYCIIMIFSLCANAGKTITRVRGRRSLRPRFYTTKIVLKVKDRLFRCGNGERLRAPVTAKNKTEPKRRTVNGQANIIPRPRICRESKVFASKDKKRFSKAAEKRSRRSTEICVDGKKHLRTKGKNPFYGLKTSASDF